MERHLPALEPSGTTSQTELSFAPLYLADIVALSASAGITKVAAFEPVVVEMPPIETGRDLLMTLNVRENAGHMPWQQNSYTAYAAATYIIKEATVHGAVGITGVGRYVVAESLWHTTPERHSYRRHEEDVVLSMRDIERLSGSHVSLLVGAAESYWHSVIDATARLTLIPDEILRHVGSVLLPSTGVAQKELIDLYGLPEGVQARLIEPTQTFQVEELVYPSSIHYLFDYHPKPLNNFFDRILFRLDASDKALPSLLYIDRRSSGLRRLVNEDDLVQALEQIGFTAVRLEQLNVKEQVLLFRHAEIIVAPHGAGLTNIGFAKPNCWVVELMMDHYLNWCYRRMAAIRSLRYDCIIGRAIQTPGVHFDSIHGQPWSIEVDDVSALISSIMKRQSIQH